MKKRIIIISLILFGCQNEKNGKNEIKLLSSIEIEVGIYLNQVSLENKSDSIWELKVIDDSILAISSIGFCENGEEVKSIPAWISNGLLKLEPKEKLSLGIISHYELTKWDSVFIYINSNPSQFIPCRYLLDMDKEYL